MPRVTPLITNFNAGEWSALLYGRPDLGKYPNACRRMVNAIPLPQGPARRRPGTHFVAHTRGDAVARLIPFEFSTIQAYVVEATDLFLRFYKDRGVILSGGLPYEIASVYGAAHLAGLKWTQSADVMYIVHPLVKPQKLTRTGHTAWTIAAAVFTDGPYLDVNTTAVTLTPSATSGAITITASSASAINGGLGFLTTDVGRFVRIKHGATWGYAEITGWTSATVVNATVRRNFGAATAQTSWALGAWSDTTGFPGVVAFHEERLVFANTAAQPQTIWLSKAGDYENFMGTEADGTVLADNAITFTLSAAKVHAIHWIDSEEELIVGTRGGAFIGKTSNQNEPLTAVTPPSFRLQNSVGAADRQSVHVENATLYVQRAERSLRELTYRFESDSHEAADLSLLASHIATPRLSEIVWQESPWGVVWAPRGDGQLAGLTYLREQQVVGWHRHPIAGRHADAAGVTRAWGKVTSSAVIAGVNQDELWLVVERTVNGATARHVEYMDYEFIPASADDKDGAFFVDAGLTLDTAPAATLTPGGGAVTVGATDVPFIASAGVFAAGDVGREIKVLYETTKIVDGLSTPAHRRARAAITSVILPTEARATILSPFPSTAPIAAGGWGLTSTSAAGLDHLEGETVQILGDGAAHPDKVVAGGMVTFDRPIRRASIGLGFTTEIETMDLEQGSAEGAAMGKPRRIHKAAVKLVDTLGAEVGGGGASLETVEFRTAADALDESPPLFTGDKIVTFSKGWDRGARVFIRQSQALPLIVAAVAPQMSTSDA